jgi:hypothetical protein
MREKNQKEVISLLQHRFFVRAKDGCFGYTRSHQIASFKVMANNTATRTAELRQAEHFAGLLTSTCCNIFVCTRINEIF